MYVLFRYGFLVQAVKLEVNLPACKSFVEMMYTNTYEMAKKARHAMVCTDAPVVSFRSLIAALQWYAFHVRFVLRDENFE